MLYGAADAEETFLLDFFIGSMVRDHEAYGSTVILNLRARP